MRNEERSPLFRLPCRAFGWNAPNNKIDRENYPSISFSGFHRGIDRRLRKGVLRDAQLGSYGLQPHVKIGI